jgi:DHA2 family lincomycin resistance protein-like MFS transporter
MGSIMIVIAVAPAIGPTIGGAVLTLGWRWMFFTVLPLALACLVIGLLRLHVHTETRKVPLDVGSVLLSALGFGGVLYGLSVAGEPADVRPPIPPWLPVVLGGIALVVFAWRQTRLQRRDRPLLDLRPFTHRRFTVALVLTALLFMALIGAGAILLPLFLQTVLHTSTLVSGLAVLPGGLVLGLLGRPVGSWYDKIGARPLVIPGAAAMAASLWLFATLGPGSPLIAVIGIHVLLMAGLGLMMTPLMTDALGVLPNHLHSHGSAILATLQQVSGALGTTLFITVATVLSTAGSGTPDAAGLRGAFIVSGCIGVVAFAGSWLVRPTPPRTQDRPPAVH